jgi:hypothetical protein
MKRKRKRKEKKGKERKGQELMEARKARGGAQSGCLKVASQAALEAVSCRCAYDDAVNGDRPTVAPSLTSA